MRIKPVIVGTDGSRESLRAVGWAAREAALRNATLRIVSVPAVPAPMTAAEAGRRTVSELIETAARDALASAVDRVAELAPGLAVEPTLVTGLPAIALLGQSASAAMLVIGAHRAGGVSALVLGSVGRYLATRASCPVVIAREEHLEVHREIIVGVHGPDQSAAAIGYAFEQAALWHARLLAVHVSVRAMPEIQPVPALAGARQAGARQAGSGLPGGLAGSLADTTAWLNAALAPWREKYPTVPAGWEFLHARPAQVLTSESARADLLVLGRHADGWAAGPVVRAVLSRAHGSVVIVPGG